MKFAHIDKERRILGWYEDTNESIPTPNVEVSEDVWENAKDKNHNKVNANGTTELYDFRTSEVVAQEELEQKIAEAKVYLSNTDFKMTVDYYATLTEEQQLELIAKRAEARAFLKENGL